MNEGVGALPQDLVPGRAWLWEPPWTHGGNGMTYN